MYTNVYNNIRICFRLISTGQRPNVNAEPILWQLVKLFATCDDPTLKNKVAKLVQALFEFHPDYHRLLCNRKKALEQAIRGKIYINASVR